MMGIRRRGRGRSSVVAGTIAAVASLAFVVASPATGGASTAPDVDRDASFTFAYSTGHTSFDPHTTPSAGDQLYQRPVYDTLLEIGRDESGAVVALPHLATSYEYSDDGLSLTLTLRDDVTFQDGTVFDAEAVKANLERALGPDSTVASRLASIESVEVIDPTTVVIHTTNPDAALPYNLATGTAGMMVSPAAFDTDLSTTPVGSGPFRLVSAQRDAEVVYERWDDYWDPDAALVKEFHFLTIPDQNARYNGVRSGDIDSTFLATPLDAESRALESEGYTWNQAVSPVTVGLAMNSDMAPFDDLRVRQAVNMMLDREELSESLLSGINPPAYQVFTEGYLGYDPALDVNPFDLEAAQALIDEAGVAGTQITIIQPTTAPQDAIALVVQQRLTELGFEVELEPISPTDARTVWREGGHQGIVMPLIAEFDPAQTLAVSYLSTDNPATPPEELVAMSDAAGQLAIGSPEREAAYQEISAWLVENPVHVPLVSFSTVLLSRPGVVGAENMMTTGIAEFDMRGVGVAAG